jgi:hypothetical protein
MMTKNEIFQLNDNKIVVFVQRCLGGLYSHSMSSKVENKRQVELERVFGSLSKTFSKHMEFVDFTGKF